MSNKIAIQNIVTLIGTVERVADL